MNRMRAGHVARLPAPGVRIVDGQELYSSAWLSDSTEGGDMETTKQAAQSGTFWRLVDSGDGWQILGPIVGLPLPPGTHVISTYETIEEAQTARDRLELEEYT